MKRVLLDENLDRRLKNYFSSEFDVTSVPDPGWQSKKNGEMLTAKETERIEYLVTADRNLRFQQNLDKYRLVIVVIRSFDIRLKNLINFIPTIESAISNAGSTEKIIEIELRHD